MSNHSLTARAAEIAILQRNLNELQGQLNAAHKRIAELTKDKNVAKEELVKERQLLLELEKKTKQSQYDTTLAIEKQIEDWPDVVDSRPEKRFKPRKTTWSSEDQLEEAGLQKNFEDIKPGEWD